MAASTSTSNRTRGLIMLIVIVSFLMLSIIGLIIYNVVQTTHRANNYTMIITSSEHPCTLRPATLVVRDGAVTNVILANGMECEERTLSSFESLTLKSINEQIEACRKVAEAVCDVSYTTTRRYPSRVLLDYGAREMLFRVHEVRY